MTATRKGWTAPTLERLGVERERDNRDRRRVGRWRFTVLADDGTPCATLHYADDGRKPKMLAGDGDPRELWPRPEDVPGTVLYVVEGEPDAVSMAEIGLPAVAYPGTGAKRKAADEWPRRLIFGPDGRRQRVVFIADCDDEGRKKANALAGKVTALGVPAFVVDLAPERNDKSDVGDLLVDALDYDPEHGRENARRIVERLAGEAVDAGPVEVEPAAPDAPARKLTAEQRERLERVTPGPWPEPMADDAYHGLAGQFVRTIAPHSEADPHALLVQFLIAAGCSIGRDAGWTIEGAWHPPLLWGWFVGKTSKARKGTSAGRVRQVFEMADAGWWREHVREGLSSGEGVVYHVRDPIRRRRKAKGKEVVQGKTDDDGYVEEVEDPGVTDKRLLVLEGEFAQALKAMERDGNTLSPTLRRLWDDGTHGSLTKNAPVRTTNAHVCIIGHVAGDELRAGLTKTAQANGFGNRFLVVCVRRAATLPFGGNLDDAGLRLLAERVRSALTTAHALRGPLTMTGPAASLWAGVYPELSDDRAGLLGAITARAEAHVIRLAVVYALLDGTRSIDLEHLRAALAVWRYAEDSAAHVFGGKTGNPLADKLLARIDAADADGITRGDLRAGESHKTTTPDFDTALAYLERRGLATCEREATAGRPRERWFRNGGSKPVSGDESQAAEPSIPQDGLSSPSPIRAEDSAP